MKYFDKVANYIKESVTALLIIISVAYFLGFLFQLGRVIKYFGGNLMFSFSEFIFLPYTVYLYSTFAIIWSILFCVVLALFFFLSSKYWLHYYFVKFSNWISRVSGKNKNGVMNLIRAMLFVLTFILIGLVYNSEYILLDDGIFLGVRIILFYLIFMTISFYMNGKKGGTSKEIMLEIYLNHSKGIISRIKSFTDIERMKLLAITLIFLSMFSISFYEGKADIVRSINYSDNDPEMFGYLVEFEHLNDEPYYFFFAELDEDYLLIDNNHSLQRVNKIDVGTMKYINPIDSVVNEETEVRACTEEEKAIIAKYYEAMVVGSPFAGELLYDVVSDCYIGDKLFYSSPELITATIESNDEFFDREKSDYIGKNVIAHVTNNSKSYIYVIEYYVKGVTISRRFIIVGDKISDIESGTVGDVSALLEKECIIDDLYDKKKTDDECDELP